jgi:hypothetical protein
MSHSLCVDDVSFVYNSDLSGNVTITDNVTRKSLDVRGDQLLAFLADYVRRQRIESLEQMSDAEVLGLTPESSHD